MSHKAAACVLAEDFPVDEVSYNRRYGIPVAERIFVSHGNHLSEFHPSRKLSSGAITSRAGFMAVNRRSLAVSITILAIIFAVLTLWSNPAPAASTCTAGRNAAGETVYYCGVWLPAGGIPVYAGTAPGSAIIDHLRTGGSANWFYCSKTGATATASGYSSTSWARTIGDDHGAQGYVPAVYFSGAEDYWAGLPACGGGGAPGVAKCNAAISKNGGTVFYCPIWTPSGGVPVYSGTSTSSPIVDYLHTAGSGNWFYCKQSGGTASAGGYTSTNWAKTIGDDHGATGYVPAVYFSGSQDYWYGMANCGSPAPPPADGTCTLGRLPSGAAVYYCPVWVPSGGVPVYGSTSTTSGVVDRLHTGGSSNWFYCSVTGSTATVGGYSSSSWAKTVGDDHGATGYVPAVYFTGAQNYWPSLPKCGSDTTNPPPPPSDGGGITSGTACGIWYSNVPTLTLKLMQNMCRVTEPSDPLYQYRIYAWNGGHVAKPGPSRGSCDPGNGAPNDCNVIGFDCSGLVRYAYYLTTGIDALNGYTWDQWSLALSLPHKAVVRGAAVEGNSTSIASYLTSLKPGDLLLYGRNAGQHVAVYMGNGQQMNAYESGTADDVTAVNPNAIFWGAVRFW